MIKRPVDKNAFIAETAQKIFVMMFSRKDKDPSIEAAIAEAEELWQTLEKKGFDLTRTPNL